VACDYIGGACAGGKGGGYRDAILAEYDTICRWKEKKADGIRPIELKMKLQAVMDRYVGLERDEAHLLEGLAAVRDLRDAALPRLSTVAIRRFCYEVQEGYEVRGMIELAELVILSALERKESRGHHFRLDYPQTHATPMHTAIQLANGKHQISSTPVVGLQAAANAR
jgi:succinate dehydrogenase/fumarate reductase flavoprotein subunit